MDNQNAIEVRNMSKSFKVEYDKANTLKTKLIFWKRKKPEYHEVLKDISLNIKKGECVALIGVNGSGKSTLLKLMTKIIYPTTGTIKTYGKLTSLLELGAGFHPDFTGRENIYFNASIFGLTKKDIDKRIEEIIEFSELGEFIDNPIRTYSSGMYMRLAFSVAINVDAEILLIDEILAVGDQHFQEKCFAKLKQLKATGKTIVIVTHSLGVVKDMCHRAVWIYNGEFRLDGDPTYVIDEYLKQVEIDNKDRRQKLIDSGEHHAKAVVFIDQPRDVSRVFADDSSFFVRGWQISDSEEAELSITIDGKRVSNIDRVKRQDVYDAYFDEYVGFMDPNTIGWEFPIKELQLENGKHYLEVSCLDKGKTLAKKSIEFDIQ